MLINLIAHVTASTELVDYVLQFLHVFLNLHTFLLESPTSFKSSLYTLLRILFASKQTVPLEMAARKVVLLGGLGLRKLEIVNLDDGGIDLHVFGIGTTSTEENLISSAVNVTEVLELLTDLIYHSHTSSRDLPQNLLQWGLEEMSQICWGRIIGDSKEDMNKSVTALAEMNRIQEFMMKLVTLMGSSLFEDILKMVNVLKTILNIALSSLSLPLPSQLKLDIWSQDDDSNLSNESPVPENNKTTIGDGDAILSLCLQLITVMLSQHQIQLQSMKTTSHISNPFLPITPHLSALAYHTNTHISRVSQSLALGILAQRPIEELMADMSIIANDELNSDELRLKSEANRSKTILVSEIETDSKKKANEQQRLTKVLKALMKALSQKAPHKRAQGIWELNNFLNKRIPSTEMIVPQLLEVLIRTFVDRESYVYMAVIQVLSTLAEIYPSLTITKLLLRFKDGISTSSNNETKQFDDINIQLKLGQVLALVIRRSGRLLHQFSGQFINVFTEAALKPKFGSSVSADKINIFRSSCLSNLSYVCAAIGPGIGSHIGAIYNCVKRCLGGISIEGSEDDKDKLDSNRWIEVRRAAAFVSLEVFKSFGAVMSIHNSEYEEIIKEWANMIQHISKHDKDPITSEHSRRAIQTLSAIQESILFPDENVTLPIQESKMVHGVFGNKEVIYKDGRDFGSVPMEDRISLKRVNKIEEIQISDNKVMKSNQKSDENMKIKKRILIEEL
eukprot:TRINITY_DN5665_c0_g1_i1.p1 TRINITY_DN5665_c0_g1~~TRINITY_DN5665_c0_g1_i1.p1  ORF type:complete len:785 (+),score=184.53 TRINITY_DN5665_c0_g1_i1:154-2355(+)